MFAQEGAKVVIGDVLDREGAQLEAEIAEAGGDALFLHLDVTSEDEWGKAVATAVSRFGKLDVLVNNAAIWRAGHVEQTSSEAMGLGLGRQRQGCVFGNQTGDPRDARGRRRLHYQHLFHGRAGGQHYQHRLQRVQGGSAPANQATAIQYAAEGIRANSIHPGPIDTAMGDQVWPDTEGRETALARTPLGRIGIPEDIAYGALYVASDESSFVTDSELVIDGGVTAQ